MSYKLFKAECMATLYPPHSNKFKQAITMSRAYNNLVLNHVESVSGGGRFVSGALKIPLLIAGMQLVFEAQRRAGSYKKINIFNLLGPVIKLYWTGQVCVGPTGTVIVTNTGVFKGPPIPNNKSVDGFMKIFMGVIRTHILTLTGTYTNFYTGLTTPWTGALLQSLP
jgi:hypothetical protein